MALVKSFEEKRMDRNSIHDAIGATYTTFERDGRRFIQIDSYGRAVREVADDQFAVGGRLGSSSGRG
jgi:hypothetical protein